MNNDKKMDVIDWDNALRPVVTRAPRRFFSPTALGFFGTLAIHALIVPTAYFGTQRTKAHPPEVQEPGSIAQSKADSDESLVLITLPTISNSSREMAQNLSSLPAVTKVAVNSPISLDPPALLNVEILTLGEEQPSQAAVANADATEQARLFGIYTGQIRARIDRIWRRPRTPINEHGADSPANSDESFQCEAQIVQDARGNVQEILLPQCNGSLAWRLSLVAAIREASPLPAPPSRKVFSRSIELNFVGLPYAPSTADGSYEVAAPQLAQSDQTIISFTSNASGHSQTNSTRTVQK
jgi:hypothetical protein